MIPPSVLEGTISAVPVNVARALLQERSLINRTTKTLRVDELRFRVERGDQVDRMDANAWWTGEVQIRVGNEPITESFVPLPAMTWPELDYAAEGETAISSGFIGSYIRLSKPLLLAPGESLDVQFRYTVASTILPDLPDFTVTAMCRESNIADIPHTPWIAFFKPPPHNDGAGVFEDASTEADLVNPFDRPIFVERLLGRISVNGVSDSLNFGAAGKKLSFDAVRLRIEDHEANQIVRDPTPFGIVIDAIKYSWVVNVTLPAKGFFKVSIESNLSDEIVTTNYPIQSFVGMLGYRSAL